MLLTPSTLWQQGMTCTRQEIHAAMGGQEQGGISTPSRHPVILLFTSKRGLDYGYRDGWHDDGFYHYTGEGQRGPMRMAGGNRAVAGHVRQGKVLMVFERQPDGRQLFLGYMDCVDHYEAALPDVSGNLRPAIIFRLTPVIPPRLPMGGLPVGQAALAFLDSRPAALNAAAGLRFDDAATYREATAVVNRYVMERANSFCEACGRPAPFVRPDGTPYLEIHSSSRVSDLGPDHPSTLLAACPTCHAELHHGMDAGRAPSARVTIPETVEAAIDDEALLVVTAAVISDSDSVYVTRRKDTALWEFPGGKARSGETLAQCLVREIREELAVELTDPRPFWRADHRHEAFYLRLFSFSGRVEGRPKLRDHSAGEWIPVRQLGRLPMPPADRVLVNELAARTAL